MPAIVFLFMEHLCGMRGLIIEAVQLISIFFLFVISNLSLFPWQLFQTSMTLIDSELKYVLTDITRSGDLCLYSIKPAQTLATLLIPRPQPVRTPLQSHLVPH